MKKLFIYTLFICISQFVYAVDSDDESETSLNASQEILVVNTEAIDNFLANASDAIKEGLSEDLHRGVLGYSSPEHLKTRRYKFREVEHIIANLDKIHTLTLTHINLMGLDLTSIPQGLFRTKAIKEVNLGSNLITTVPYDIDAASDTLESLILSNNSISALPREMRMLVKLSYLDLRNNPLTDLPAYLVEHNIQSSRVIFISYIEASQLSFPIQIEIYKTNLWVQTKSAPVAKSFESIRLVKRQAKILNGYVLDEDGKQQLTSIVIEPEFKQIQHVYKTTEKRQKKPRTCIFMEAN